MTTEGPRGAAGSHFSTEQLTSYGGMGPATPTATLPLRRGHMPIFGVVDALHGRLRRMGAPQVITVAVASGCCHSGCYGGSRTGQHCIGNGRTLGGFRTPPCLPSLT